MRVTSIVAFHFAAIAACATPALAQSGHPADKLIAGTLYETTTTSSSSILSGSAMSSRMRIIEASGKIRNEVLELTGPVALTGQANPLQGRPGSYTISVGNNHMYGVDTVKREYFEVNMKDVLAKGSDMMKGFEGMGLKITDQKIEAQDMGDGGVILGHPTSHWRVRESMTMSTSMMGDSMAVSSDMTTDTYYARDLPQMKSSSPVDSTMFNQLKGFVPFIDMKTYMAERAKLPKAMPLRSVQKGLTTLGPMEVTMTTTTEVTKMEKRQFSESLFRVPKGYKLVEMPFPKMPVMPQAER